MNSTATISVPGQNASRWPDCMLVRARWAFENRAPGVTHGDTRFVGCYAQRRANMSLLCHWRLARQCCHETSACEPMNHEVDPLPDGRGSETACGQSIRAAPVRKRGIQPPVNGATGGSPASAFSLTSEHVPRWALPCYPPPTLVLFEMRLRERLLYAWSRLG